MKTNIVHYLLNCLLLLLPIMAWNVIFANKLPRLYSPDIFEKNIPAFITLGENIFRLIIFILPLFMPIRIETQIQKFGLALYIAGTVIYFFSWFTHMYAPQSAWSLSLFGSLAPAYTPLIWLTGIALIGSTLYFASPYRSWMYITLSLIFVAFHLSHTFIAYQRSLS
ncbi:MAG: hypothetical protein QM730_25005 [Anaerolineales bacterium]